MFEAEQLIRFHSHFESFDLMGLRSDLVPSVGPRFSVPRSDVTINHSRVFAAKSTKAISRGQKVTSGTAIPTTVNMGLKRRELTYGKH
jgi:hypothetical protein